MDAPAMLTTKHVPEDVGQRNIAAEEVGGQQQMHRDEKPHKPVLKKVKDKVKKIKNTIAGKGHGHGNGNGNGEEDEHEHDTGGSNSSDMDEDDAAMREAEVEKGGYQEDVEDKRVMDSSPELHGAPMYDSERIPDAMGDRLGGPTAAKEVQRNEAPAVRLGDLGGPVVEDPAAPNSKTPTPRGGEDIGTTDVVREFESMTVSDDPKQVKMDRDQIKETEAMPVSDGTGEEWTDAPTDAEYTGSYTDRLKNTAAGTTEYGKKLASTVYEKVAGVGTVVASKAQQVTPGFGSGGNAQDDSTTPEPMAVDAGKRDDLDLTKEGTPASYTGTEQLKNAATDATTEGAPGATYTDKIKSAAAGTTEYGKQLASTVYEKVAGVGTIVASKAQQVIPSTGTATPVVGAQDRSAAATVTPGAGGPGNGQDKGVSGLTAYIAEKLRPGDEERSLSEAITGAVQQRKEGVGSTVAKAREVPAQAATRAREAVTSLTGGNRVSETVKPTTEGNIGEGVAAEVPTLHGEEIGAARTNTNVM
uniref:Uncharacterized protein n=1 Tax=Avena sativa TaxID=4498 RepID=A0ACD5TIY4_AVESA